MSNDEKDYYYDLYNESRLTNDQIRQFVPFENLTDDKLEELSDVIFDLAVLAKKVIIETND